MAKLKKPRLYSALERKNLKQAWKLHKELLLQLRERTKAWVSLRELEEYAVSFLAQHNVIWSFKWFHGYPANLCLSVNDCVVHGIPDETILVNGDVLKIDCGVTYGGMIADAAITIIVGGEHTNPQAWELVETTKYALDQGIKHIVPGQSLFLLWQTIGQTVSDRWFSIIKTLTWHGVGKVLHEPPTVYNYGHPSLKRVIVKPGMVIAVEPITALTSTEYIQDPHNGWNLYTANGDVGVQWEYTIMITEHGYEVVAGIE